MNAEIQPGFFTIGLGALTNNSDMTLHFHYSQFKQPISAPVLTVQVIKPSQEATINHSTIAYSISHGLFVTGGLVRWLA